MPRMIGDRVRPSVRPTDHVAAAPVGRAMDAEVLVVPDCPYEQPALELFRRVLDDTGHSDEIRICVIRTAEEAARRGFRGSPTFLIDGVDLFLAPSPDPAIACRLYPTRNGLRGLPSRDDLINAVMRLGPRRQT